MTQEVIKKIDRIHSKLDDFIVSSGKNNQVFGNWIRDTYVEKNDYDGTAGDVKLIMTNHLPHLKDDINNLDKKIIKIDTKMNVLGGLNIGGIIILATIQYVISNGGL